MRKHYALLASALLCVAAAQAQDAPTVNLVDSVTFNVQGQVAFEEDGQEVPNWFITPTVDATVDITLHGYKTDLADAEGWEPYVMWTMGSGFAIGQNFEKPEKLGVDSYSFTLNKAKWGNPYEGNYYATVMLLFVKLEDDEIVDMLYGADEEPVFYDVSYSTPNVFPAELQYTYPNNDWSDETFAEAYENGTMTVAFSNEITFENQANIGSITYDFGDKKVIPITVYESDWNRLDGYWAVTFDFRDAELEADDLINIKIQLAGVKSVVGNSPVSVPVITLENATDEPQNSPRKVKNRLESGLTSGNEIVNVYNIQGMLVKESVKKSVINDLPAGLYIVEGKKVIVR